MLVVEQTYKYRVYPTNEVVSEARRHINICREVYNHALGLYDPASNGDKPTYTRLQNKLPTGADANDNSSFRLVPAKHVVETGSHGSPDPW